LAKLVPQDLPRAAVCASPVLFGDLFLFRQRSRTYGDSTANAACTAYYCERERNPNFTYIFGNYVAGFASAVESLYNIFLLFYS
jgi:hypothetical protein